MLFDQLEHSKVVEECEFAQAINVYTQLGHHVDGSLSWIGDLELLYVKVGMYARECVPWCSTCRFVHENVLVQT
jgi:hypothetical protein